MAPGHSLSGLALGLGVASLPFFGFNLVDIALIGILLAGAALLPDLDIPMSTASTLFWPRRLNLKQIYNPVSIFIEKICVFVYQSTSTPKDIYRHGGHRTLTHTIAFGLFFGGIVWVSSSILYINYAISFVLICLALRGVFAKYTGRHGKPFVYLISSVPIALMPLGYIDPLNPLLLAIIVTLGIIIHNLGDGITNSGIPFLWPVKIKGQRWYRFKLPLFETGSDFEKIFVNNFFRFIILAIIFYNVYPLGEASL